MFVPRQAGPRLHSLAAALLFTASCAAIAAAQSAATTGDQWRAAGSSQSSSSPSAAQSVDTPATNPWQLPNSQPANSQSQPTNDGANPLRKNAEPQTKPAVQQQRQPSQQTAQAREPRAFQPPTNVKPLNASTNPNASQSAVTRYGQPTTQNRSVSAAAPARPTYVANQAYMPPRTLPNRSQQVGQNSPGQPTTWSMGKSQVQQQPSQLQQQPSSDSVWDAINVAFQGTPTQVQPKPKKTVKSESLPMPGFNDGMPEPVFRGPTGPDAWNQPVYGEPGMCCNDGSCPNGCCNNGCCNNCGDDVFEPSCGCPCGAPCGEPACACEPNCGCTSGGNCQKDCLCIGPGDDESCHVVKIRWPKWQEVMVFGGVQGFKDPYDAGRDAGNFGFNEGFNIGAKVPYCDLGYQYGYRVTENQLNGDAATDNEHQFLQEFVTAGLFHRSCEGLQFGVVWDALIDERNHAEHFHQIRSELSVIGSGCHEIGFGATVGLNRKGFEDDNGDKNIFQASDQYVVFYRLHGPNGGEGRIYAGANNDSDGIVGSDMLLPVGDRFSVNAGFTYLIPNERDGAAGASQEAWNIGVGLTWHWDRQAHKSFSNCYRPLFDVANNGTLIVDQQDTKN